MKEGNRAIITRSAETGSDDRTPPQRRPDQAELDALHETATQLHALMAEKGVSEEEVVAEFKARRASGRS